MWLQKYLAKFVYRPPRSNYDPNSLTDAMQSLSGEYVARIPFELKNSRGLKIIGSIYMATKKISGNPAVLYLHGNASSQREGAFLTRHYYDLGISVVCVDLSGSGMSEGETLGMGYTERDDVRCIINFIRQTYGIENVALFGRSMGAATAAWFACENTDISGIICDSSYISLWDVLMDFTSRNIFLRGLAYILYPYVDNAVKKYGNFSMNDINYRDELKNATIPALFVHAYQDNFVGINESQEIFSLYGSKEKFLLTIEGGHNNARKRYVLEQEIVFLCNVFGITEYSGISTTEDDQQISQQAHFTSIADMMAH
ncbi:Clan SC, family S9, unassigned serine peptidase [Trichomonas vaginalis G3]|uniref:Clan SC, family S9, unassigned serine peptidase n=1 Tax=Trichomonas vaginalis (strain ATCC PRA-98 / G3) TaxID=412133 RepID=A2EVB2_TRIV3|nr:palmitoyl-(protein) hydrolase protein [Trichomonas vaginalis G3]EAY03426.1 Clan SC, family S9, unassigned serine peptidase [Trichomonas vaginalis G3]KAI5498243.1 palmitoyl-(protein) hydrolase protein [Trichomonas vaginalis G3]|eukprot:XP_001315649.1 Clan SC, family S9, unassigned serine peptidase [Trichomonas vaginalis G3]